MGKVPTLAVLKRKKLYFSLLKIENKYIDSAFHLDHNSHGSSLILLSWIRIRIRIRIGNADSEIDQNLRNNSDFLPFKIDFVPTVCFMTYYLHKVYFLPAKFDQNSDLDPHRFALVWLP